MFAAPIPGFPAGSSREGTVQTVWTHRASSVAPSGAIPLPPQLYRTGRSDWGNRLLCGSTVRVEYLRCSLFRLRVTSSSCDVFVVPFFFSVATPLSIHRPLCARPWRAGRGPVHLAYATGDSIRLGPQGYPWSIRAVDRLPKRHRTIVQRSKCPGSGTCNHTSEHRKRSPAPYRCVGR
jgi:hypothetical protein